MRGGVRFDHVSFHCEQSGRPLLRDIDFAVPAGQTLAIVGPGGSGKTTLMALMMRFYDPLEGVIRLDGHDLRGLKQSSIRRNIGVVLQDPLLFNDSVRANEEAVQSALETLMRGRTTFIIAHQLSTVANADRILVLEEGRIIKMVRTRISSGRAVTTLPWCAGSTAASSRKSKCRATPADPPREDSPRAPPVVW